MCVPALPSTAARRRSRVPALATLLMVAAMALQAQQASASCVRLNPGDQDLTVSLTMPNLDRPDTRFRLGTGGAVLDSFSCTAGQTAFNIDAPLTGLTYVRDIQHNSYLYKVYSTGPRSPLIGFSFSVQRSGNTVGGPPIAIGTRNRHPGVPLTAPGPIRVDVYMEIFFRGGAMESIPMTDLGTITSSVEGDPSQSMQHHVRLEITVPPRHLHPCQRLPHSRRRCRQRTCRQRQQREGIQLQRHDELPDGQHRRAAVAGRCQ